MFRLKFDTLKKAKPPSKLALEDDDESFYLAKSTAFAGVQTAFGLFKEVAGKTGVPGLQEGVKAMVIILDAMQVRLNIYIRGFPNSTTSSVFEENISERRRHRIVCQAHRGANGDLREGNRRRRVALQIHAWPYRSSIQVRRYLHHPLRVLNSRRILGRGSDQPRNCGKSVPVTT